MSFISTFYFNSGIRSLFPELNETLFALLIVNEVAWLLELFRRMLFNAKKGMDGYDAAITYIKGTFVLDLAATLPQVVSYLNERWTFLKVLRLCHLHLLHTII